MCSWYMQTVNGKNGRHYIAKNSNKDESEEKINKKLFLTTKRSFTL